MTVYELYTQYHLIISFICFAIACILAVNEETTDKFMYTTKVFEFITKAYWPIHLAPNRSRAFTKWMSALALLVIVAVILCLSPLFILTMIADKWGPRPKTSAAAPHPVPPPVSATIIAPAPAPVPTPLSSSAAVPGQLGTAPGGR